MLLRSQIIPSDDAGRGTQSPIRSTEVKNITPLHGSHSHPYLGWAFIWRTRDKSVPSPARYPICRQMLPQLIKIFTNAEEQGTEAQDGDDGPLKPFLPHPPLPTYVEGHRKGSLPRSTMLE